MSYKDILKTQEILENAYNQAEGEITPEIEALENEVKSDLNNFLGWAIKTYSEDVALAAQRKEIAKQYTESSKVVENRAQNMKKFIDHVMHKNNIDKKDLPEGKLSYRKGSISVLCPDAAELPDEYVKTSISADKTAIKTAIELGKEIKGCSLVRGEKSLQIKI